VKIHRPPVSEDRTKLFDAPVWRSDATFRCNSSIDAAARGAIERFATAAPTTHVSRRHYTTSLHTVLVDADGQSWHPHG